MSENNGHKIRNILIIDDEKNIREGLAEIIGKMGHKAYEAESGEDGVKTYEKHSIDLVITDVKMAGISGHEVLKQIRTQNKNALVVIITAFGDINMAVDMMKNGAIDFWQKGIAWGPKPLREKINSILNRLDLLDENEKLKQVNRALIEDKERSFDEQIMIGRSEAMKKVRRMIEKVAPTDSSVLITGASGTGKELVAQEIHNRSLRSSMPFIKTNCGALVETLLESELFGHERGSFTGAIKRKLGRFELADGGTLFLDEIGEISLKTQVKLLRVLQQHEFERVGGEETIHADVRVVTATNRDLKEAVKNKLFREDLYYRLNVVNIDIPPLRARASDIPDILEHFLTKLVKRTNKKIESVSDMAMAKFSAYKWDGNVRELENAVEQSMIFCDGDVIDLEHLPTHIREYGEKAGDIQLPHEDMNLNKFLEEAERQLIIRAYHRAKGVKTETAKILGIKTSALYYKLDKFGIGK